MRISIIVPIYNVEKYIGECIESILSQSYKDFELLLIDDGSTDNSYKICKSYAKTSNAIKLIKKNNGGVSNTRNIGLDLAKGDYITFIDSDDFISSDYLETLQANLAPQTEFIFSGIIYYKENRENKRVKIEARQWNLLEENDFRNFLLQSLQTSPCAKLYKNSILKEKHLRFDEALSFAEDRDFNIRYFNHIVNAKSISYCGYCYRYDAPNSLSKQLQPTKFKQNYIYWNIKYDLFKQRSFFSQETTRILVNDLYHIVCDEISDISKNTPSLSCAHKLCFEEMSEINFNFLKQKRDLVKAPKWQKFLLIGRFYLLLIIINQLYFRGQEKG